MKVKFLSFYQGALTYPHAHNIGDVVILPDDVATELVKRGVAEQTRSRKAKA